MIMFSCVVSRKTPRDGKLEIPAGAMAELRPASAVVLRGESAPVRLVTMPCTCRGPEAHEHYFLESDVLKSLPIDARVDVAFDAATRRVTITL
jgi:hypothetical protein